MSKRAPSKSRLVKREDGLTVMHATRPNGESRVVRWWCWRCSGMKPAKWQVQRITSLDEAFIGWDIHKGSPTHQHSSRVLERVDDIASTK